MFDEKYNFLRNKDFLRLAVSNAITSVGWWLTYMALFGELVFEIQSGPISVAVLTIVAAAPSVVVSPISGTVADLVDKRRLMYVAEMLSVAVVLVLFATDSRIISYISFFVLGVLTEIYKPALRAFVPEISDDDQLLAANAVVNNTSTIARIAGPAAAGALLTVFSPSTLYLVDAISYVVSVVLLFSLSTYNPSEVSSSQVLSGLKSGFNRILGRTELWSMLILSALAYAGAGAYNAVVPIYVRDVLTLNASVFGYLTTGTSVGAFLGTLLVSTYGDQLNNTLAVGACTSVVGVGVILFTMVPVLPVLVFDSVVIGLAFSGVGIYALTAIQRRESEEFIGQITGIYRGANKTGQLAAMAVAGVAVSISGVLQVMSLVGIGLTLLGGVVVAVWSIQRAELSKVSNPE
jgi:MFS family permease